MLRLGRRSLCSLILGASAFAQSAVPPGSIGTLIDLEGLPRLSPGVTCRQFASTDPSGRGEDHGHFLRVEGDRCVLAEMDGPGVIARLWSANAAGRLRVFIDGEDTPRIDGPFEDLFTGKLPPFVEPIAVHRSGGWISYFPIPYAKSCRVEVAGLADPRALYYQVQYLSYPKGTAVRSFTTELPASEKAALDEVLRLWRAPGPSPIARAYADRDAQLDGPLPPGMLRPILAVDEPGTVLELHVAVDGLDQGAMREIQLVAAWDGDKTSIEVPLGDLFGVAFGATPYHGLALGWDESGGYCNLPMPFAKSARIALRNRGAEKRTVHVKLRWRPGRPAADAGALHAEFRAVDRVGDELYEFAKIDGPGKFVGILQALQGVGDLWYLEGNEQFFVEGESAPSILGTGTDDFYNGGWYWDQGTFALPLHGLGVKAEWTTNRTTPWRIFVPDAVPFATGLVARIEHGSSNQVRDAYYSSVALWYGPLRAVRPMGPEDSHAPRLWVTRPRGFVGAAALHWEEDAAVTWQGWEDATNTHRGLDRPLFQSFPVSYVERDSAAVDPRVAVFTDSAAAAGASFEVPFADRYRLALRVLSDGSLPAMAIDGHPVALSAQEIRTPLHQLEVDVGALSAGRHHLSFSVAEEHAGRVGLDALRISPASPFVHVWRVGPPVPARKDGTVEDEMECEALFLADGFDPAVAGWKRVESGDSLDLNGAVSPQAPMLAYLMVFVHSQGARTARFLLGSDDGARVWVNGELRWSHELHRHLSADEDSFDVPLKAGWNPVLVKVKNDYGGYGVMLRIADPDGDLRVAAEPR